MVNLHGPDCAKILRDKFHYGGLIIGVTGNAMVADIELFVNAGADAVLTKPISMEHFLSLLRSRGLIR